MPLNTIPNTGLTNRGYPSDRLVTPIIINGDMSVAQRGTSFTGVTGNGYAIDRFRHQITSAGTWTISQSTDVPTGQGFAYSQKWDCTTADASLGASDRARMMQRIEGNTLAALKYNTSSAESITISFWVKSNKTGTYSWSANDNSNTKLISASYTIDSANTWEKKILTFAGTNSPSISINNTDFLQCSWWLGTGSTYSGGTYRSTWTALANSDEAAGQTVNLADSTSNEWYITGVQLEVGEFDSTTLPSFPFESFESNQLKCKRYYQIIGEGSTGWITPAANYNGTYTFGAYRFMPEMRTSPSISVTTGTDYYTFTANSTGDGFNELKGQDFTSMSCQLYSDSGVTATSAGQAGNFRVSNSSAKAAVDAEL